MYILVEIIHTEFQYISLIEMQKYNWNRKRIEKRKTWKKRPFVHQPGQKGAPATWALPAPFVPVGVTNRDKRSSFVPVARPGTKGHPLLSRTGVPGWETGTTAVSQSGQINVFVVVPPLWEFRILDARQNVLLRDFASIKIGFWKSPLTSSTTCFSCHFLSSIYF